LVHLFFLFNSVNDVNSNWGKVSESKGMINKIRGVLDESRCPRRLCMPPWKLVSDLRWPEGGKSHPPSGRV